MFVNMFEENNKFARDVTFRDVCTLAPCKGTFEIQTHVEKHKRKFDVMCISRKVTHPDTVDTTYDSTIHC